MMMIHHSILCIIIVREYNSLIFLEITSSVGLQDLRGLRIAADFFDKLEDLGFFFFESAPYIRV